MKQPEIGDQVEVMVNGMIVLAEITEVTVDYLTVKNVIGDETMNINPDWNADLRFFADARQLQEGNWRYRNA